MGERRFDLLLIGGGHAHCAVLADWIKHGVPARRAGLLTPNPFLRYSGMVPGWIAGQYGEEEGRVNLRALAAKAGIEFIQDSCVAIDADARALTVSDKSALRFDKCSIDTGGVGRSKDVLGFDHRIIDVRPIDGLAQRLSQQDDTSSAVIIGGGAGGVELAFALNNRNDVAGRVTLVTGKGGLLPEMAQRVRRLARHELAAQSIDVIEQDAGVRNGVLQLAHGALPSADIVIAALGSDAPDWPGAGGLEVDKGGFIVVDRFQRSVSHPYIFAAGDVASRRDRRVPRSGVHSVHTGPVLAANLRATCDDRVPTQSYKPRPASLYLLSTGNGSAILSYGPVASKGRWAARLKRWIDKRWIATYARLTE